MKDIKSRLIAIARIDLNRMSEEGRFDKVSDLTEIVVQYNANKITRSEFLKQYSEILERD